MFEPVGKAFQPLRRVGRVAAAPEVVVLRIETIDGLEYVLVNSRPGTTQRVQLPGGRFVSFDGLALRVREHGLVLAGGTFAEGSGRLVSQASLAGTLTASVRAKHRARTGLVFHSRTPARRSRSRRADPDRSARRRQWPLVDP